MDKEIIEKLNLKPTDKVLGNSFKNNITVYEFQPGIYAAACTTTGEPDINNIILFFYDKSNTYKRATIEFLKDVVNVESLLYP